MRWLFLLIVALALPLISSSLSSEEFHPVFHSLGASDADDGEKPFKMPVKILESSNLVYPANISATYKGSWGISSERSAFFISSPFAAPGLFESSAGTIAYRLRCLTTSLNSTAYLNGELLFRDGFYSTSRDFRYFLRGIYFPQTGQAFLTGQNTGKQKTLEFLVNATGLEENSPVLQAWNETLYQYSSIEDSLMVNENIRFSTAFEVFLALSIENSSPEVENQLFSLRQELIAAGEAVDSTENQRNYDEIQKKIRHLKQAMAIKGEIRGIPGENQEDQQDHLKPFLVSMASKVLDTTVYYKKASDYILFSIFCSAAQILLLVQQMRFSSTQAARLKLSQLMIGAQALMDSYLALFHLITAIVVEPLFESFAIAALFQFTLFAWFEMRFLLFIFHANHPEFFQLRWEQTRPQILRFYGKFYFIMLFGIFIYYKLSIFLIPGLFLLYSYWIPQIIWNIYNGTRKGLLPSYIIGTSGIRLLFPLYLLICPVNWLNHQPNIGLAFSLLIYVALQAGILLIQNHYGARYFIPRAILNRFLPARYDYHRTRPFIVKRNLALERIRQEGNQQEQERRDKNEQSRRSRQTKAYERLDANESGLGAPNANSAIEEESIETPVNRPVLDEEEDLCSICCCEFELTADPMTIMTTPCNHSYHTNCLLRWMAQKLECPQCRGVLPVYGDGNEAENLEEPENLPVANPVENNGLSFQQQAGLEMEQP